MPALVGGGMKEIKIKADLSTYIFQLFKDNIIKNYKNKENSHILADRNIIILLLDKGGEILTDFIDQNKKNCNFRVFVSI